MSHTHQLQLLNRGPSCVNLENTEANVDDLDLADFPTDSSENNACDDGHAAPRIEAHVVRWLALLCACCFGIGSH